MFGSGGTRACGREAQRRSRSLLFRGMNCQLKVPFKKEGSLRLVSSMSKTSQKVKWRAALT